MAARVGQHQRSRLSVMTQTFCESVEQRLIVDQHAFTPVPEVFLVILKRVR
jgi:16S rRNA A1518/A1519 N6-dimethyltransferase RsmA/KsgA/DIM1 with predicted DNA glycosylase/AP lyase activity